MDPSASTPAKSPAVPRKRGRPRKTTDQGDVRTDQGDVKTDQGDVRSQKASGGENPQQKDDRSDPRERALVPRKRGRPRKSTGLVVKPLKKKASPETQELRGQAPGRSMRLACRTGGKKKRDTQRRLVRGSHDKISQVSDSVENSKKRKLTAPLASEKTGKMRKMPLVGAEYLGGVCPILINGETVWVEKVKQQEGRGNEEDTDEVISL